MSKKDNIWQKGVPRRRV